MDNILLFKSDLEHYPTSSLRSLQRYFGLPNAERNDLIWLIAINQASGLIQAEMPNGNLIKWARDHYVEESVRKVLNGESNELSFENNRLTELPVGFGELTNLKVLYLNDNDLIELPADFGKLVNLQELILHRNILEELPAEIGKLSSLRSLSLSHNNLTTIPAEIGELGNLVYLNLAHNDLKELSAEIGDLTNLEYLDLRHNELEQIPIEIGGLTNLQDLKLDDNPLEDNVPRTIKGFQQAWREHLLLVLGMNDNGQSIEELNRIYKQVPQTKSARKN